MVLHVSRLSLMSNGHPMPYTHASATQVNLRQNKKETIAKLQCGASSPWVKQYGTDQTTDGRMDG
jgi:hypothetical protein